jgi:hypothetical protein
MLAQPGATKVSDMTVNTQHSRLSKIARYRPVMRPNVPQSVIEFDHSHGVLWNTIRALDIVFSWGWRPGLRGEIKSGTAAAE